MPVQFNHAPSGKVTLKAPASGNLTLTLPGTDGSSGQALVTDGSGNLSFGSGGGGGGGGLTLTANGTVATGGAVAFTGGYAEPISSSPASFVPNLTGSSFPYTTLYPGNPYPTYQTAEWYGPSIGGSSWGAFGIMSYGTLDFYGNQPPSSTSLPSGGADYSLSNVTGFKFVFNAPEGIYLGFYFQMGAWYAAAFAVDSSGAFTWINSTYIGGSASGSNDIAVVTSNTGATIVEAAFQMSGSSSMYKLSATYSAGSFGSTSAGYLYANYSPSSMGTTTVFSAYTGYSQEVISQFQQGAAVMLNYNSGQPHVFTYYGSWQNYSDFLIPVSCDVISNIVPIKGQYLGFFTASASSGIYWVWMDIQNPSSSYQAQNLGSWPGGFSWTPLALMALGTSTSSPSASTSVTCIMTSTMNPTIVVVTLDAGATGSPSSASINSTTWSSYSGSGSIDYVPMGRGPQGPNGSSAANNGAPAPATFGFTSSNGAYNTGYHMLGTSQPATSNTSSLIGVATAGASSGGSVTVGTLYNTVTPNSGSPFTVGQSVYVDSTGTFNQSGSGTLVGIATSSTQVVVTNVPGF